jgi:hypothetical protein
MALFAFNHIHFEAIHGSMLQVRLFIMTNLLFEERMKHFLEKKTRINGLKFDLTCDIPYIQMFSRNMGLQ